MDEEQITEVLYSQDLDTLLTVIREKFACMESEIESRRKEHQHLCVEWIAALGNPQNPEELDRAIADTPILRAELKRLRAELAQPREDWNAAFASLTAEYDRQFSTADALRAKWESIPWAAIREYLCATATVALACNSTIPFDGERELRQWLTFNAPQPEDA